MTRPLLLCSAYPFGYGPVVKLMLLAEKLRQVGFRTLFAGSGIALTVASSSGLFEEVVETQPGSSDARRIIGSADALLSVMERDLTRDALEVSKTVYVVDSLRWMREEIPRPFLQAREYWCQRFLPSDVDPAPGTLVGPLVKPMVTSHPCRRSGLVVNLGGCETAAGPSEEDIHYGKFIVMGIEAMLARRTTPNRKETVRLIAGKRCIERLTKDLPDCRITMESVTHSEALRLFDGAESVLTSPGLTTTLECFQLGVPTFFLPPQNYSQSKILSLLAHEGLAPGFFDWSHAGSYMPNLSLEDLPLEERTPAIRRTIKSLGALSKHSVLKSSELLGEHIRDWITQDRGAIAERQHGFFESLGANGVDSIVSYLLKAFGLASGLGN